MPFIIELIFKITGLFKNRRLQTHILFETISILFISLTLVIGYTYYSNTNAIIQQSQMHLKDAAVTLKQRIYETLMTAENVVKIYTPLLAGKDLTKFIDDIDAMVSMSAYLNMYPYLTTIYFGTPAGLYIEVATAARVEPHIKSLGNSFPENTTGVLRVVNHNPGDLDPETNEMWYYLQANRALTTPRMGERTSYDARKRPWYVASSKSQKLEWSDIYVFASMFRGEAGITASQSIIDTRGNFKGVFAADITLKSFSQFLAEAKVSPHSIAFVVDDNDQVVATSEDKSNVHVKDFNYQLMKVNEYGNPLLKQSMEIYKQDRGKDDFVLFRDENKKEFISVYEDFPKIFSNNWKAVIISPTDDFVEVVKKNRNNTLVYSAIIFLVALLLSFRLARRISKPIVTIAHEANKIRDLELDGKITIESRIREIGDLVSSMNSLKTTMQSFSYFIPRSLVRKLLHQKQTVHIGGKSKEVTLMFSDIAGFTTVSEACPPDKLVVYLSEYFEEMTRIVMEFNGTVDKYIGDAIMAFWGAPLQDRHHAHNACHSALVCQRRLVELNRQWKRESRPVFVTRMGIHTGEVIIGNIGSSERMNYTAIGDSVNLGSRLEGLNKYYGTKIIVSETVYDHVKDSFLMRSLDKIAVKGKSKAIKVYELVAQLKGDPLLLPTDEDLEFCQEFERAYRLFLTRQWKEALEVFENIPRHLHPNDLSVGLYIERCKALMETPPPQDWDGSSQMTSK